MSKILANDGIDATGKMILEKAGHEVITEKVSQDKLISEINAGNFSALTVRSATQVSKDVIDGCPGLKVIGRGGVGMDNIEVEYAKSKGIAVVNTPAASSNSVAELVFAHLFSLSRLLHFSNRIMPLEGNRIFGDIKKRCSDGLELRGKTIGIIGFGRIGQSVAKIALGCGMKVLAYDPFVKFAEIPIDIFGFEKHTVKIDTISLDDLLGQSHIITIHVPSGKMIGAVEIEKMKKGVVLLNTARGGVIDEAALLEGLDKGQISCAALDVFENEPMPNLALLRHDRISLSPHIGASTREAQERIGVELANKIIEALS